MNRILTTELRTADRTSQIYRIAGGRSLGYAEFGDPQGKAVLALHGTPGSRFMFALTDEAARARRLRIVAPERPGYGLSDYAPAGSLMELAADIAALADALQLEDLALLGVSGGAPHALAAAAALHDRVALLALISPVGPVADCKDRIRMSRLHRFIFTRIGRSDPTCASFFWLVRMLVRTAPDVAYRGLMQRVVASDRALLKQAEVKANLQAALKEGLRRGIKGARQDLRLFCAPWRLRLEDIDVPTLIWQGSDDTIVPPGAAYKLAELLPNCQLNVVQGAGHYWVFGAFTRVLDTIQAALKA
ncbi:MAG TPA: alpha/beta hydrolase [Methyloceanibacter sp.]|nr:alpha/beta hydrolase [Methyloceanibacter sp.]